MSMIKLQMGSIVQEGAPDGEIPVMLERRALLVYSGTFQSMDGQVEVKDEHIDRLAANHNTLLKKLMTGIAGELPIKYCPPIQLDHSLSAKDTVGRLTGLVEVGQHTEDGQTIKALYGKIKILGRDNVEKVLDGRWSHLSIGADLDEGKFQEVTITPFPAAGSASMMSRVKMAGPEKYKGQTIEIIEIDPHTFETAITFSNGIRNKLPKMFGSYEKQMQYSKTVVDDVLKKNTDLSRFSQSEYRSLFEKTVNSVPGVRPTKVDISASGARAWYGDKGRADQAAVVLEDEKAFKSVKVSEEADNLFVVECVFKDIDGVKLNKETTMFEKLKAHLMRFMKLSEVEADKKLAEMPDEEKAKLMTEAEASQAKRDRMKGYLMAEKGMDAEGAEKHLTEVSQEDLKKLEAEVEEGEKLAADKEAEDKLTADADADDAHLESAEDAVRRREKGRQGSRDKQIESEKAEKGEKWKYGKMSTSEKKAELTKLASGIRTKGETVRLAARQARIVSRLSSLKASMKITPAEIKKVDLVRLSKENDATVEAVLSSYANREPVIMTGLLGSTKAMNVAEFDKARLSKEMNSTILEAMPFSSRMIKGTKLANGEKEETVSTEKVEMSEGEPDMAKHLAFVHGLVEGGKSEEAMKHLKHLIEKCSGGPSDVVMAEEPKDSEARMSSLAEQYDKLQNEMETMLRLVEGL